MKAAPVFDCSGCRRRIGKTATHYLLDTGQIVSVRCLTRKVHAVLYPDCPRRWHDLLDHTTAHGTRAGIAHVLGLWP
jgi:hypothetical protein